MAERAKHSMSDGVTDLVFDIYVIREKLSF